MSQCNVRVFRDEADPWFACGVEASGMAQDPVLWQHARMFRSTAKLRNDNAASATKQSSLPGAFAGGGVSSQG
jgi:hypothetical protein